MIDVDIKSVSTYGKAKMVNLNAFIMKQFIYGNHLLMK